MCYLHIINCHIGVLFSEVLSLFVFKAVSPVSSLLALCLMMYIATTAPPVGANKSGINHQVNSRFLAGSTMGISMLLISVEFPGSTIVVYSMPWFVCAISRNLKLTGPGLSNLKY